MWVCVHMQYYNYYNGFVSSFNFSVIAKDLVAKEILN